MKILGKITNEFSREFLQKVLVCAGRYSQAVSPREFTRTCCWNKNLCEFLPENSPKGPPGSVLVGARNTANPRERIYENLLE